MDITQDINMKKILTHDAGLGASGCHLYSGDLTLQGGESNFGVAKVELQQPRLMGGNREPPVSFVRLAGESAELSMAV